MKDYRYNLGLEFYAIAEEYALRTALRYPDGDHLSYADMNRLSNQIGRYLLINGITKGDVVAIFNEKSPLAYSLMISCLKIGAIYSNLDGASPWARLDKIINTCKPRIIFTDFLENTKFAELKNSFPSTDVVDLKDEVFQKTMSLFDSDDIEESLYVHGGDPAYIMFTSGSTGFPKGAVMSHDNVMKFIQWGRQTFNVTELDILTNANPIYFDNSVFDFYTAVYNGAILVPLGHELVKDAKQLVKAINDSNCTIWFSVPSLLVYLLTTKSLTKEDFASITRISFGGEGFPKNKLKQLYEMFAHRVTLYNVYGPTECTCICSSYIIGERDFENMNELAPLGNISPNFDYEIIPLDRQYPKLGELALIGPCVGLGYYNDPERTQKSFVQNTGKRFTQKMYMTGDLVEQGDNDFLYFKGRVDNQIKHMGYRIELEEIEAAFSTLNYIDEVGVIYEKLSAELGQIKAFASTSVSSKDAREILADIRKLLPSYMVPRTLVILETLPKNANGKIDRKQLTLLKA